MRVVGCIMPETAKNYVARRVRVAGHVNVVAGSREHDAALALGLREIDNRSEAEREAGTGLLKYVAVEL